MLRSGFELFHSVCPCPTFPSTLLGKPIATHVGTKLRRQWNMGIWARQREPEEEDFEGWF